MSAIALQALADETGGQLVGESVALQNLAIDSINSLYRFFTNV